MIDPYEIDKICIMGAGSCIIIALLIVALCFFITEGYNGWGTSNKH